MARTPLLMTGGMMPLIEEQLDQAFEVHRLHKASDRDALIREVGPPGWLRVSVGTPRETQAFKDALVEVAGL